MLDSKPNTDLPWAIFGDFNQTLLSDRKPARATPDIAFRQLVHSLNLIDLRPHQRSFTWYNERDPPIFTRLDRFLINNAWSTEFPNNTQQALTSTTSDHCPVLTVVIKFPLPNTFRFENFWLRLSQFKDMIGHTLSQ
jgi:endonuclease/exonuclease/phosphatase family metal-dependent hydrolase